MRFGDSPHQFRFRRKGTSASRTTSPYEPSQYLLEESRKSWDHVVSDKIVYAFDPPEVTGDIRSHVAESYIKGDLWIEFHLSFERLGNRYAVILEASDGKKIHGSPREMELSATPMNGNPSMFVDIAHQVELPEKVLLDNGVMPSVMWLKQSMMRTASAGTPLVYCLNRSSILRSHVEKIGNCVPCG